MSFGKASKGRTVGDFPFYVSLEDALEHEEANPDRLRAITLVRQKGVIPAIIGFLNRGENLAFVVNRTYRAAARIAQREGADFAVVEHVGSTLDDGRPQYHFPEFELKFNSYKRKK